MSLTEQQVTDALVKLHARYLASEPFYIDYVLGVFHALSQSVEERYLIAVEVLTAVAHESTVDPTYSSGLVPEAYLAKLTSAQFVDFMYPSSAIRSELIAALDSGVITKTEFAAAAGLVTSASPTAEALLAAVELATGMPVMTPIELPDAAIAFPGVNDAQVEFVTAMYIGAFSRAPEFEGLKFWTGELAGHVENGASAYDSLLLVGENMYRAGAENGEGGTSLNNRDYVEFAYSNSLGRQFDQEGFDYWVNEIDNGMLSRGQFLTTFIMAALQNPVDGEYLQARVAVAEHAAQAHVSGAGAQGIDLIEVIAGIVTARDALKAIDAINDFYGVANAMYQSGLNQMTEHKNAALAEYAPLANTISLTGAVDGVEIASFA